MVSSMGMAVLRLKGADSSKISRSLRALHFRPSLSLGTPSQGQSLNLGIEASPGMDPPHFRAGSEESRCGTCQHYSDDKAEVGYCRLYERPMFVGELCDSWTLRGILVWRGKR